MHLHLWLTNISSHPIKTDLYEVLLRNEFGWKPKATWIATKTLETYNGWSTWTTTEVLVSITTTQAANTLAKLNEEPPWSTTGQVLLEYTMIE